ncbi:DUF4149 domain-containing protein [Ideonella sp. A 288]|uniref:DUF4149 domain-containing protein n=1 Tax=Ideonella sp. A 288 TaxID=1962181 RepID=UPI0018FE60CB|nr:DUF4149 domain-containing protein [Ideonella sp. A 288]
MSSGADSQPGLVERLRRILPAAWAGMLLCVAGIAAPAAFATQTRPDAGRLVGHLFTREAWTSVVLALLLLAIERRRARDAAEAGQGSVLSTEMLLVLGAVFCTVAGYFGVQPLMAAAREGQGTFSFGQLHLISTAFFAVKIALVALLAWRATHASR